MNNSSVWRRILTLVIPYWRANDRQQLEWPGPLKRLLPPAQIKTKWIGRGLLLLLLIGLASVNWLNVQLNFAYGGILDRLQDFAAAGQDPAAKDAAKTAFYQALFVIARVFVIGTFVVVFYRWIRAKLSLSWRQWLTTSLLRQYLNERAYYRIGQISSIDNPDERLANDVDAVVAQTLLSAGHRVDNALRSASDQAQLRPASTGGKLQIWSHSRSQQHRKHCFLSRGRTGAHEH